MTALGLGDVGRFPFVDPPDQRNVKAGVQLLEELGALVAGTATCSPGSAASSPAARSTRGSARMVVEADRLGCLREVLVIAAALSVQDPRERPAEQQAQADQMHARFRDESSDFLTLLNLWRYVRQQQRDLSSSAFRRMCRGGVPQLPADPGVAGARGAAAPGRQAARPRRRAARGHPGRGRDPPVAAVRAALAHRPAGPGPPRLPGRAQRAVLDLPRVGAVQEAAAVRDVRRARRDLAAVGPDQRRGQAGVGRGARRAPGQAHLVRAALVEEAGGGDGLRAGHAVRRPAGRRPAGVATARSTRRWPASCSSGTRWSTASGRRGTGSSPRNRGCSRRSRSSSTGPAAATSWSTSTRCSTSTTPGWAPRSCPARTSTRGGRRHGSRTRTC